MIPRATYRLQFHKGFPFAAGADLAPYLAKLGISHVYASPILKARAGSTHCYDTVDHSCINPELGGEAGFRDMAQRLRDHDIGIILDIVPNHMAVGGKENRQWLDVLAQGEGSRYAHWFDINFKPPSPDLAGKILVPFLEAPYREVLATGKLVLAEEPDGFAIHYHDHVFPIRPEDHAVLRSSSLTDYLDPGRLEALLANQHYRLAWWRTANDQINWRRFFDITELAGLSVEHRDVFDAVHDIPLRLYAEGLIDGLRVDHVDGLTDPIGYCRLLRQRLDELTPSRPEGRQSGAAYLIIEKILAVGEALDDRWPVHGTSGYDFMNAVSALQHDTASEAAFTSLWTEISGRSPDFEAEERIARQEILHRHFPAQLWELCLLLTELSKTFSSGADLTPASFSRTLTTIIANLRVYRSYARTGQSIAWGPAFLTALQETREDPFSDHATLAFIASLPDLPAEPVLRRLHQLCTALAAKAVEDTAFYRYGRLLSRNDVGFSPAQFSLTTDDFHAAMTARSHSLPHAMLATATHDHKRGEDVRARLAVLSEIPEGWRTAITEWIGFNAAIRPPQLAPADEYQLYQMLVGAWPLELALDDPDGLMSFRKRIALWQQKSLREGKLRSSWQQPDETAEAAADRFLADLLDRQRSGPFLASLTSLVAHIVAGGALNGLVQAALRNTLPGVPDLYQGCEFWDLSLVDPDNRRPVDFKTRSAALDHVRAGNWQDGSIKQHLIAKLLALRRANPGLFTHGTYEPLEVTGTRRRNLVAFYRRHQAQGLLVAVPIHCGAALTGSDDLTLSKDWWGDTCINLPDGQHLLHEVLLDRNLAFPGGKLNVSDYLPLAPVLVCAAVTAAAPL